MGLRITGQKGQSVTPSTDCQNGQAWEAGHPSSFDAKEKSLLKEIQKLLEKRKVISDILHLIHQAENIVHSSASPALSDKERKFLFIEYQALRNEILRMTDAGESSSKSTAHVCSVTACLRFQLSGRLKNADVFLLQSGVSLDDAAEFLSSSKTASGMNFFVSMKEDIQECVCGIDTCLKDAMSRMSTLEVMQENLQAMGIQPAEVCFAAEHLALARASVAVKSLLDKNLIGIKFRR